MTSPDHPAVTLASLESLLQDDDRVQVAGQSLPPLSPHMSSLSRPLH